MLRLTLMICLFLSAFNLFAEEVNGEITEDTVWSNEIEVVGDVIVLEGVSLDVDPGTLIEVMGEYRITIEGKISAVGTEEDSIYFFSEDDIIWDQIRVDNSEVNTFQFCDFRNAEIALRLSSSEVTVSNCSFYDMDDRAIDVLDLSESNSPEVLIQDCLITRCQRHGVFVVDHDNTTISDCDISYCALDESPRGAIQLSCQSNAATNVNIENNHIHNNVWQGMTAFDVTGAGNIFIEANNNLIEENLTGVYLLYSNGTFTGNTIRNNFVAGNANSGAGVMLSGSTCNATFVGNSIHGNYTAFYIVEGASANLGDLTNDFDGDDGYNQFYDNVDMGGHDNSIYSLSNQSVMAENNYWGTTDIDEIEESIHDGNDQGGLGIVDFEPIIEQINFLSGQYFNDIYIEADTVYIIDDVNLFDCHLIFSPGTSLLFEDPSYKLNIYNGSFIANSIEEDSIRIVTDSQFDDRGEISIFVTDFSQSEIGISVEHALMENIDLSIDIPIALNGVYNLSLINSSFYNCSVNIHSSDPYLPEYNVWDILDCYISNSNWLVDTGYALQFWENTMVETAFEISSRGLNAVSNLVMDSNINTESMNLYMNENVVTQSTTSFKFSGSGSIYKNRILSCISDTSYIFESSDTLKFVNNLICNNETDNLICLTDQETGDLSAVVNNTISNNDFGSLINSVEEDNVRIEFSNNSASSNTNNYLIYTPGNNELIRFYNNNFHDCSYGIFTVGEIEGSDSNLNFDPLYVQPSQEIGNTVDDLGYDWSLNYDSSLINAGTNDFLYDFYMPPADLNGNPRIFPGENEIIDIGAYEYQGDVGIDEEIDVPNRTILYGNYPNPFNPSKTGRSQTTSFSFYLDKQQVVVLEIYNIKGQKIKSLSNEMLPKGHHEIIWNGDDFNDNHVSSGVYYYRFSTSSINEINKLLLLK